MSANVDTVLSGLDDLPVIARSLISASSPGWCASLSLEPFLGDGESCAGVAIGIDPAGAAVSGELLRVNGHLLDDDVIRLEVFDFLRRELEPLIEGIGQVRVIRGEELEGFVVLPA